MKKLILILVLTQGAVAFGQDARVIEGKNRLQDEVLMDLILDSEKYNGQMITLRNVTYVDFGFNGRMVAFFQANPWFRSAGTYGFQTSDFMDQSDFNFWFQPSDQASKRLAMQMVGKYYTAPKLMTITGKYVYHQIPYGPSVHLFLVEFFTLNGTTYQGTLPSRISE